MPGTLVRRPRVLQIATSVVPSLPSSQRPPRSRWSCGSPAAARGHRPCRARHGKRCPKRVAHSLPYLTDSIQNSITVNWATTATGTTGRVQWGPVGNCAATTTTATKTNITVNSVAQFQWKASLPVSPDTNYCYRVLLDGIDLLGSDPTPTFTSQHAANSSTVQLRRLWRLGSGVRRLCQPGPGQRPQPDRTERRPFRRHDRRHRISERRPEELR